MQQDWHKHKLFVKLRYGSEAVRPGLIVWVQSLAAKMMRVWLDFTSLRHSSPLTGQILEDPEQCISAGPISSPQKLIALAIALLQWLKGLA